MRKNDFSIRLSEGSIVNCYCYVKPVKIDEVYLELDRQSPAGIELETQLIKLTEAPINNNIIYSIEIKPAGILHVQCLGSTITIGIGVRTEEM